MRLSALKVLSPLYLGVIIICMCPKSWAVPAETERGNHALRGDTAMFRLLIKQSESFILANPDSSINFARQALSLAQILHRPQYEIKALHALGRGYWYKDDFEHAYECYSKARDMAVQIQDYKKVIEETNGMGVCFLAAGDSKNALDLYKSALAIAERNKFSQGIYESQLRVTNAYRLLNQPGLALKAAKRLANLTEELKDLKTKANGYKWLGIISAEESDYKNTAVYYEKSKQLSWQIQDIQNYAETLQRISDMKLQQKNYNDAIHVCSHGISVLKNMQLKTNARYAFLPLEIGVFYGQIGHCYLWEDSLLSGTGRISSETGRALLLKARASKRKAENYFRASNHPRELLYAISDLVKIEKILGNYKQAVLYEDTLTGLRLKYVINSRDDLAKSHLKSNFTRQRDSAEYAAKAEKLRLTREKADASNRARFLVLYIVIVIILALFAVSFLFYRSRVQRMKFENNLAREKLDRQLKEIIFENRINDLNLASLKAQMNPHFIFNCLNSIKMYLENNRAEEASDYISKFSRLIRTTLDIARSERITLANELELIELYLKMESLRFKGRLHYQINVHESIDPEFIEIAPLLIQPYAENAVIHGILPKKGEGTVRISIDPDEHANNKILIKIQDDGIGRKMASELKKRNNFNHQSHGTNITNERIELLNTKKSSNIRVTTHDLYDDENRACGTLVTVNLTVNEIIESSYS